MEHQFRSFISSGYPLRLPPPPAPPHSISAPRISTLLSVRICEKGMTTSKASPSDPPKASSGNQTAQEADMLFHPDSCKPMLTPGMLDWVAIYASKLAPRLACCCGTDATLATIPDSRFLVSVSGSMSGNAAICLRARPVHSDASCCLALMQVVLIPGCNFAQKRGGRGESVVRRTQVDSAAYQSSFYDARH